MDSHLDQKMLEMAVKFRQANSHIRYLPKRHTAIILIPEYFNITNSLRSKILFAMSPSFCIAYLNACARIPSNIGASFFVAFTVDNFLLALYDLILFVPSDSLGIISHYFLHSFPY